MVDFMLYMGLSILETSAMFYLTFKIFKIDIYMIEILFAGIILAFISYVLRYDYGIAHVDILTQYILAFCFIWLLFRTHIFYAAILNGLSYLCYTLIQSTYLLILNLTGLFHLQFPSVAGGTYLLQVLSAVTTIIIGSYIGKKRKGFDFVPDKPYGKVTLNKRDIILFAVSVPSILLVLLMIYLAEHYSQFFFLIPLGYGIILYAYLSISSKKDRGDYEFNR
ncbi:hypothetical protein J7E73_16560 [Paenibacillus albidus]|uniref:hypothetical protein n=1 Tax=Paenibacillus albidus TaxID=2041023 RepID=UPI001BEC08AD|nr:hypothetical protein [Paenibacillus albidus]MBT2290713.1 hypothetical protein [Paenibacillus albidus]